MRKKILLKGFPLKNTFKIALQNLFNGVILLKTGIYLKLNVILKTTKMLFYKKTWKKFKKP